MLASQDSNSISILTAHLKSDSLTTSAKGCAQAGNHTATLPASIKTIVKACNGTLSDEEVSQLGKVSPGTRCDALRMLFEGNDPNTIAAYLLSKARDVDSSTNSSTLMRLVSRVKLQDGIVDRNLQTKYRSEFENTPKPIQLAQKGGEVTAYRCKGLKHTVGDVTPIYGTSTSTKSNHYYPSPYSLNTLVSISTLSTGDRMRSITAQVQGPSQLQSERSTHSSGITITTTPSTFALFPEVESSSAEGSESHLLQDGVHSNLQNSGPQAIFNSQSDVRVFHSPEVVSKPAAPQTVFTSRTQCCALLSTQPEKDLSGRFQCVDTGVHKSNPSEKAREESPAARPPQDAQMIIQYIDDPNYKQNGKTVVDYNGSGRCDSFFESGGSATQSRSSSLPESTDHNKDANDHLEVRDALVQPLEESGAFFQQNPGLSHPRLAGKTTEGVSSVCGGGAIDSSHEDAPSRCAGAVVMVPLLNLRGFKESNTERHARPPAQHQGTRSGTQPYINWTRKGDERFLTPPRQAVGRHGTASITPRAFPKDRQSGGVIHVHSSRLVATTPRPVRSPCGVLQGRAEGGGMARRVASSAWPSPSSGGTPRTPRSGRPGARFHAVSPGSNGRGRKHQPSTGITTFRSPTWQESLRQRTVGDNAFRASRALERNGVHDHNLCRRSKIDTSSGNYKNRFVRSHTATIEHTASYRFRQTVLNAPLERYGSVFHRGMSSAGVYPSLGDYGDTFGQVCRDRPTHRNPAKATLRSASAFSRNSTTHNAVVSQYSQTTPRGIAGGSTSSTKRNLKRIVLMTRHPYTLDGSVS
ncbi:unnamed protein product [Phytomonas sp. Hart1]|nr:unnamed protein product [Phytomonas sp. Hart1]|eukprot:CCW69588.1 unnamed protein product [Phytomonas sp. isolate Hart1]